MELIKSLVHKFGRLYNQKLCKVEYETQQYSWTNERPVEYRFVFQCLLSTNPKTVLDVGTGITALPSLMRDCGFLVTATDNIYDYWEKGMVNRHFHVVNDDITRTQIQQKFDFISCISVLEHIRNHEIAIQNMFGLLNNGGYLVLSFPYNENKYIDNVYKLPGAGYGQDFSFIGQMYSRNELDDWLGKNKAKIIEQEYWRIFTGDYWAFGEHVYPPKKVAREEKHQLTCILIQKS